MIVMVQRLYMQFLKLAYINLVPKVVIDKMFLSFKTLKDPQISYYQKHYKISKSFSSVVLIWISYE